MTIKWEQMKEEDEDVIKVEDMSLERFKQHASHYYPYCSKILLTDGEPLAFYDGETQKITIHGEQ